MKKVLKTLVKAVTDGDVRVCSRCPYDLGLPCSRGNAEDCEWPDKKLKRYLRKCWKMVIKQASE